MFVLSTAYLIAMFIISYLTCSVVVWNLDKKDAICGSPAQVDSAGKANTVAFANNSDDIFVTGGEYVSLGQ